MVPTLLGWYDPGHALSAVIERGSSAAVIAHFRLDLGPIRRALLQAWYLGDCSALMTSGWRRI
jgi:undecaprenyl pyrophosphate phosphatase UppP